MNFGPEWADIELKIGNSNALDLFSKGKITEIEILEDYKNSYIRVYKDNRIIKS